MNEWRNTAERGSILGIRTLVWLGTVFGRWPARAVAQVVAFYYALFATRARQAARQFSLRVGGRGSFGEARRAILRFSQVTLDGLFFASHRTRGIHFTRTGSVHLETLKRERKSAVLLGAHLGSFYAMRAQGGRADLPLYAVVYTRHAQRINRVLDELDPDSSLRLIQMTEGVDFVLRIKALAEEGALIALLGDRVGERDRSASVEFLGQQVRFPVGPYVLAAALKLPVYLTFGLYHDPDRYDLYCEPFADRIELPRATRQEALQSYAQRFAHRLEHYCRLAPDNWFNFYDFFGQ